MPSESCDFDTIGEPLPVDDTPQLKSGVLPSPARGPRADFTNDMNGQRSVGMTLSSTRPAPVAIVAWASVLSILDPFVV
jgi:hypothetical protein